MKPYGLDLYNSDSRTSTRHAKMQAKNRRSVRRYWAGKARRLSKKIVDFSLSE